MSDLRELYQQMILDHGRHPRNFGSIEHADCCKEGYNPLCGDKLTLYLTLKDNKIDGIKFDGEGCAISMASASLMTEYLKGKDISDAALLFDRFHEVVLGKLDADAADMGKLSVLAGVAAFPTRVKCATLCWHTLLAALRGDKESVSTE
ncbi:MAG: SUF system NifU family Fe-S cluster assembly protein [Gammaproteobacteria bacterium]|nr:SUF system NifU family Fe-S cluster assembly protein [Gammaproteobacteria bacterium]MCH9743617.1 SUF system NifU family Fe-S cluster assembly protein [Gammaproteobacteria bacterium]